MLSRLRIERQKRDGGDYAGAEEDGEDYDDNDDSNLGDGNDDDFNWPAADVTATGGTIDKSCASSDSDTLLQPTSIFSYQRHSFVQGKDLPLEELWQEGH